MSSPVSTVPCYEIWFFERDGDRGPLDSCGLYGSRGAAAKLCGALFDFVHLGLWTPPLDSLTGDGRDDLLALRSKRASGGGYVSFVAKLRDGTADNRRGPDDDGDDSDDDDSDLDATTTEPPGACMTYDVGESGT